MVVTEEASFWAITILLRAAAVRFDRRTIEGVMGAVFPAMLFPAITKGPFMEMPAALSRRMAGFPLFMLKWLFRTLRRLIAPVPVVPMAARPPFAEFTLSK